VFCRLVVLVRVSVPVQKLVSEMTYNVLMGTLNPTHSVTHSLWLHLLPVYLVYREKRLVFSVYDSVIIPNSGMDSAVELVCVFIIRPP